MYVQPCGYYVLSKQYAWDGYIYTRPTELSLDRVAAFSLPCSKTGCLDL